MDLLEVPEPSKDDGMPKAKRIVSDPKKLADMTNTSTDFRPCLKAVLKSGHCLEGGNGHDMRVAIAAEAKCSGLPLEEAVKLFSHLPDFDETITRKHLESVYSSNHGRHRCDTILEKTGSIIAPYCLKCCIPWASGNLAKYGGAKCEVGG